VRERCVLLTRGFATRDDLDEHFQKHGREFAAATAAEYEVLADQFLGGPPCATCVQCRRRRGDTVRYDWGLSQNVGILSPTGHILTFFKVQVRTRRGRVETGLDYFTRKCRE
jgi:pyocin large subunit-like protein